ncbi:MAG TPA: ABC transporter permease [Gemmatirosa sp.]
MSEAKRDVGRRATSADADDVRSPLWGEALAHGALVPAEADEELTPDDEPLAPDDVDGNLRRYARWQWRDFWRNRGSWLGLGALLGVWLLVYLAWHGGRVTGPGGVISSAPMPAENVRGMAHVMFILGGALAGLVGVGGLVSRERERGLQRFLFAKPVRPVRYYLQAFAINSVGALLVVTGAVLVAGLLLGSLAPVGTVLGVAVGAYLLTAGVTFLASTLIRFDAPVAAAWMLAGFPMAVASENHWPIARILVWLFPQGPAVALVKAFGAGRGSGNVVVLGALVVLVAVLYGLLALGGGVAVLRRRAIST